VADFDSSKENNFTILRIVLALLVVFSHCMEYTGSEPLLSSTGVTLGNHAVFAFFAVSGFLVSSSLDNRGFKDYIIARLLRIYPALIFVILLLAFILGPIFTRMSLLEYFSDVELYKFIIKTTAQFKSNTILPGLFSAPIQTVWTLKYEMFLYIILLCLAFFGIFKPKSIFIIFIIFFTTMLYLDYYDKDGKWIVIVRLFTAYFFGSTFYHFRSKNILNWRYLTVLLILSLLMWGSFAKLSFLIILECYFSLLFALKSPKIIAIKDDISYGIYLAGWFPIKILKMLFPELGVISLTIFSFVISILYGFCSWRLVEKPALKLKKHLVTKK
jgi:peptidoglycan/LPS O-acetylase OafA/YrhL